MLRKKGKSVEYGSVSIPKSLLNKIDSMVDELGYWPSRSAFVRDACLQKIEHYKREVKRSKGTVEKAE